MVGDVGVVKRLKMIWFGVFEKIIKNWSEAPIVKDLVGGQKKLGKGNFFKILATKCCRGEGDRA